jgi:hypothetical protein
MQVVAAVEYFQVLEVRQFQGLVELLVLAALLMVVVVLFLLHKMQVVVAVVGALLVEIQTEPHRWEALVVEPFS